MKFSFKSILKVASLVVLAVMALSILVGCSGPMKAPSAVDASSIKYDGKTFTWGEAKNASTYEVQVNGKTPLEVSSNAFGSTAKEADDSMTITITAKNEKGSSEPVSVVFTRLDTITDLTFDAYGVLSWSSVDGASSYIVSVDGKETEVVETSFSDFPKTGNRLRIKVKPISTGQTYSFYSAEKFKTYLAAPTNIHYDGQRLTWNGSGTYATNGYDVYINGANTAHVNVTSYSYKAEGSFDVYVIACGDTAGDTFASEASQEERFTFLPLITTLTVKDGKLYWEPVEEATCYLVSLNGTERTAATNEYTVQSGREYSVSVRPMMDSGSHFFSDWSLSKQIYILDAPTLRWDNSLDLSDGIAKNNISWNLVSGNPSGYAVTVKFENGESSLPPETTQFSDTQKDFTYAFSQVGTYTVSVVAVGNYNANYYDSAPSQELHIVRLPAPTKPTDGNVKFISSNEQTLTGGFTVNFAGDSRASGYQLYKGTNASNGQAYKTNNVTSFQDLDVVPKNNTEGATLIYSIQTLGSGLRTDHGESYVYLSSLLKDNLSFDITVLAVPTGVNFQGFTADWDDVNGAFGYVVQCEGPRPVNESKYPLQNLPSGTYDDFAVVAMGNKENVLPSNPTPEYKLVRLEAPTNLNVGTIGATAGSTGDDGKLTWREVLNANGYTVYFGNDAVPQIVNQGDNIYQYISTKGTHLHMTADANRLDEATGIYYITSPDSETHTITRIDNPEFPTPYIDGAYLVWNKPSNINGTSFQPTYVIYDADGYSYNGERNAEQFNIYDNFDGGADYLVYVQAIGDGTNFINSERYGSQVQFYLLQTPVITRTATGYQWQGDPQATSFEVKVNDVVVATIPVSYVSNTYNWEIELGRFPNIGNYTISVQAIGSIGNGKPIVSSRPGTLNQVVELASTPEFAVSYSEEHFDENGKILVNVTKPADYTRGYYYVVGGAKSEPVEGLSYQKATNTTGKFEVYVQAIGGVFDDNNVLHIASDYTRSQITLLAAPSGLDVSRNGVVSWTAPNFGDMQTKRYKVVITFLDPTKTPLQFEVSTASFTLNMGDALEATKDNYAKIEVFALGGVDKYENVVVTSQAAVKNR